MRVIDSVGLDKVMFEGTEPAVFEWYVKNYGNEVNLFVDHSRSCSPKRCGRAIWGHEHLGRIQNVAARYAPDDPFGGARSESDG